MGFKKQEDVASSIIAKHMKAGRPVQWLPEINQFVVFRKPIDMSKNKVSVGGRTYIEISDEGKARNCVSCNKGFDDGREARLFAYTDIARNQHYDVSCNECLSPDAFLIPYDYRKEEE